MCFLLIFLIYNLLNLKIGPKVLNHKIDIFTFKKTNGFLFLPICSLEDRSILQTIPSTDPHFNDFNIFQSFFI